MNSVAKAWGAAVLAMGLACPAGAQQLHKPHLSSPLDRSSGEVSTDGNLDLAWRVDDATAAAARAGSIRFEIEESSEQGLSRFDGGPHLSAALSGRDNGRYRYRVRTVGEGGGHGPWSDPIEVRVAHHPLWLAGVVFGVGAVVFLSTAIFILVFHRRVRAAQ